MGDVLLVLTPPPILPARMPAALGHRKRHLSQGWMGNAEHCHCSVQVSGKTVPQAEPDLAQPSLVIWLLWDLDHVSEPSFLLLGDGSSKNTPKCYDEEGLAYSRCQ